MTSEYIVSIYGTLPLNEDEKAKKRTRHYEYFKALINAELLNPEPDYDGVMEKRLLKMVSQSCLDEYQRTELTYLISPDDDEEED